MGHYCSFTGRGGALVGVCCALHTRTEAGVHAALQLGNGVVLQVGGTARSVCISVCLYLWVWLCCMCVDKWMEAGSQSCGRTHGRTDEGTYLEQTSMTVMERWIHIDLSHSVLTCTHSHANKHTNTHTCPLVKSSNTQK